jgi:hypothetical protein
VVAVGEGLGLPEDPLLDEPQSLAERPAALVFDRAPDLDPVQPPDVERVLDEGRDGPGHQPTPLVGFRDPVADADAAVLAVERVVAEDASNPVVDRQRNLKAAVRGGLLASRADELEGARAGLRVGPRHPAREVGPVGVDQLIQLVGVSLGQRSQPCRGRQLELRRTHFPFEEKCW